MTTMYNKCKQLNVLTVTCLHEASNSKTYANKLIVTFSSINSFDFLEQSPILTEVHFIWCCFSKSHIDYVHLN